MIYVLIAVILFFFMFVEKQKSIKFVGRQERCLSHSIRQQHLRPKNLYIICSSLIFVLFAFRGENVGGDTIEYVAFFMNRGSSYGSIDLNNLELGFNLFVKFFQGLSKTPFCFIFFSTLVTLIPFFLFVKRYGTSYVLPFLYILCFISFTVCIETNLRQNIAVGAFLLAVYIFISVEYKTKHTYLLCILLLIFSLLGHNTNLIVVPLFIGLIFIKFKKKITIPLMAASYVISLVSTAYFSDIFYYFNILFASTEIFSHYSDYGNNDFYELGDTASFNFLTLSMTLWPMLNIAACDEEEENNIFMKCMVVNCVVYNFCCSFPIAFRMIYLFQYLSLCYVPRKVLTDRRYFLINVIFILSWIRVLFNTAITPAVQNEEAHMFPYNFIWE